MGTWIVPPPGRCFCAKRWWAAISIGLALGIVTQLVFGAWLGLSLPAGPALNWIPIFNG